jgi:hypothetical protein
MCHMERPWCEDCNKKQKTCLWLAVVDCWHLLEFNKSLLQSHRFLVLNTICKYLCYYCHVYFCEMEPYTLSFLHCWHTTVPHNGIPSENARLFPASTRRYGKVRLCYLIYRITLVMHGVNIAYLVLITVVAVVPNLYKERNSTCISV